MEHENILAVTKINGYLNNCLEDIHEINILLNESQFSCHLMLKEKLMSCQDNFRKIKEQIKSTDNECPQVHKFVASDDSNNNNIVAQSNNIQVYHIVFCQYNIQQKSLTVTFNNSAHQNKAQRKNSGMMVKKYSKINLAEDIQKCCKKERQNESDLLEKMKEFMLQQLKIHRDLHKTQLVSLCDEISMKQSMIEYLMFEKEKQEETGKGWNLKDWMWFRRIHATQDIKLLEESLAQEIQKLHNLRKSIVAEANNGIRKSKNNPELECLSNEGKKHIISVLENNLVHLTREQNELVYDATDLRSEQIKLERKFRTTIERVKELEAKLKGSHEPPFCDWKKFSSKSLINRFKEAFAQQNYSPQKDHSAKYEIIGSSNGRVNISGV